ncbi:MAG TPA: glycine betaine ABC transporter substrate-binding protein [Solirubrobacterales bacterium]|nr:glycine betaine ABC transporter substrate-binding protein [Solirubrobacterales bacterium]
MRATNKPLRALLAAFAVMALALFAVACGDDDSDGATETTDAGASGQIESNPDNSGTSLTIGSKNFTEQIVLGEIFAQALEAAGYDVKTDLNLGSEQIALRSLKSGDVDGYPEYTSTALTSFFDLPAEEVPSDAQEAADQASSEFEGDDVVVFEPTPFVSANAVGLTRETAEELDVETISDLEGVSQDLTLFGSPECRQRVDCLVGLEENYGLEFAEFNPVDIGLRYEVLDKGQADLSILFTTDAQLAGEDSDYVILEDDQEVFPAGNVIFLASGQSVEEAGPDYQDTIELVQSGLTEEVMQELNARVDLDKEDPADVADDYLVETGYIQG